MRTVALGLLWALDGVQREVGFLQNCHTVVCEQVRAKLLSVQVTALGVGMGVVFSVDPAHGPYGASVISWYGACRKRGVSLSRLTVRMRAFSPGCRSRFLGGTGQDGTGAGNPLGMPSGNSLAHSCRAPTGSARVLHSRCGTLSTWGGGDGDQVNLP